MVVTADVSPREAEVLELIGEHLSNAEIGARLFISVRTVESHVSSLLRKLEVPDRRALAGQAARPIAADGTTGTTHPASVLPAPLTSFVGRASERAELTGMIVTGRQVTALGPGGVGKTRLALMVAADAAETYADGVWFVDLVPVTGPGMVAAAVAGALGLGEEPGRDLTESVIAALADQHALLVLDNCEQVRDGVALFLERLLAACPRLAVLATSRARLMVPFERIYQVPPLSLGGDGESDAVALFTERAAAVGRPLDPSLRAQVAVICDRLDGMALAIELAAARYPTLGLDGLTAALSHPLRMLTGGSRAEDRHRSVRAALDWSHTLLEPSDRALLRQVSLFVAPFTSAAAAEVAGVDGGMDGGVVADGLARLAEQSLLVVTPVPGGTGYRALETIRQYGTEQLVEAGELAETRSRHLCWCLARAADLAVAGPDWRARFDAVADDLRAALKWAADLPEHRADAYRLARSLADLTFTRHLVGESQARFEQAAALAEDPADAASMLRNAAAVAGCRMRGDDMYRLHREAADAARRAGDTAGAAVDLATVATTAFRFSSKFVRVPPREEAIGLITEARGLAGESPSAQAAVALAEAGMALLDAFETAQSGSGGGRGDALPETIRRAERAVELARRTGDPLAESAALDTFAAVRSWAGDAFGAAETIRRRAGLLAAAPVTPAATHELIDALAEAAEAALGIGDLPGARRWARQLADHPLLAEVGHRATSLLLVADALAGNVDEVLTGGVRFLDTWRRSGSRDIPVLGAAAAGVRTVHGLRHDDEAQREWQEVLNQSETLPEHAHGYGAVFDAILLLHHGQAARALERMAPDPEEVWRWITWTWLHWYVALRAEATVLAGSPNAAERLADARTVVSGNPVATAIVERAEALLDKDRKRVLATADAFEAAGCRYQSARSLILTGGEHATRGAALLSDLGLTPMAVPGG
ncbi:ATP-binding protein [Streptosporangium sp. NPDC001559]|uniref:ATP-binding protein n=1 Tax=Streptosporangium sp. NPDC001559 TaxID=3366187 RepID=UPI0036EBB654